MSIAVTGRAVVSGALGVVFCPVRIRMNDTQTVRARYMACKLIPEAICIAQAADKTFLFQDETTRDYSAASEITFDVWPSPTLGAIILSKSLTGSTITLINDYTFSLDVTSAESGALTPGPKYYEAWATASSGERRLVAFGSFNVQDTRKFD